MEVWGHVGDYEVCIILPLEDARSERLLSLAAAQSAKFKLINQKPTRRETQ